jgi:hypothetical protein
LAQLDTADRQEASETIELKKTRLKEKLTKLKSEMAKLEAIEKQVLAAPDQQISLTDPDSRSMATSGRGSGVVGYNVQTAVDTKNHLIVAHEVSNVGSDRSQLANTAKAAKEAIGTETLAAIADRGYFNSDEIKTCVDAGITVTLPKPIVIRRAILTPRIAASGNVTESPSLLTIRGRPTRAVSRLSRLEWARGLWTGRALHSSSRPQTRAPRCRSLWRQAA